MGVTSDEKGIGKLVQRKQREAKATIDLIENVWALVKNKLRKQWRNPNKRPHNSSSPDCMGRPIMGLVSCPVITYLG